MVRNLLEKRRSRRKEERFVVEGPHLVEEALLRSFRASEGKAGDLIDFVVYAQRFPVLEKLKEQGIDCYKVSREQFADLSGVETPQGILAVVKERPYGLRDVLQAAVPLVVVCAGVQDPGNLGTIIRTADAVGASGVVLTRGTVDLYNPKALRSTMGSVFHLPIVQADEAAEALGELKKRRVRIIAADAAAKKDHYAADYKLPCAILVGNEGAGLDKEVLALADEAVRIPMPGKAESLNVGISTAVILYEALRQRKERRKT